MALALLSTTAKMLGGALMTLGRSIPYNTGIGEMFGSTGAAGAGGTVAPSSPLGSVPNNDDAVNRCNDRWNEMNETANNSRWESTSDGRVYGNDRLADQVQKYRDYCHDMGHFPPGTPDRVAQDRTYEMWDKWWK